MDIIEQKFSFDDVSDCIEIGAIIYSSDLYKDIILENADSMCKDNAAGLCLYIMERWRDMPLEEFISEDHHGYITEFLNYDPNKVRSIMIDYFDI